MKLEYTALGNDLYCKFNCTCPEERWKDSPLRDIMKTTIRLTGYNDNYFFDEVNKEPKEVKCKCGNAYMVQWFRDGVEIKQQKEIK